MAAGLTLILRNSARAMGGFARAKRRWPGTGGVVDLAMRRGSARAIVPVRVDFDAGLP